jgi:hypothetical protein
MFRERYNGRQQALFHVLAAYSVYNSEVGYCQGKYQKLKSKCGMIYHCFLLALIVYLYFG